MFFIPRIIPLTSGVRLNGANRTGMQVISLKGPSDPAPTAWLIQPVGGVLSGTVFSSNIISDPPDCGVVASPPPPPLPSPPPPPLQKDACFFYASYGATPLVPYLATPSSSLPLCADDISCASSCMASCK